MRKLSETKGKIVGNKQNHSAQTNNLNIPSIEIQFSI